MKISYECEEIIEELKADIAEFGEKEKCYGVYVKRSVKIPFTAKTQEVEILVNYLLGDKKPTARELEGGRAELSTLGDLLVIFEKQNKII